MSRGWALAGLLVALLGVAGGAQAASSYSRETVARATRLLESARQHLDREEYEQAVDEYLAAYKLVPEPNLYFNIGNAYRLKGDRAEALDYLGRYLVAKPYGSRAARARELVAQLENEQAREAEVRKEPLGRGPEPASVALSSTAPAGSASPARAGEGAEKNLPAAELVGPPAVSPAPRGADVTAGPPSTSVGDATQPGTQSLVGLAASPARPRNTAGPQRRWLWGVIGGALGAAAIGVGVGVGVGVGTGGFRPTLGDFEEGGGLVRF